MPDDIQTLETTTTETEPKPEGEVTTETTETTEAAPAPLDAGTDGSAPASDVAGGDLLADVPAEPAPEEAPALPLDSSAATDASPAAEATDAPADATAPAETPKEEPKAEAEAPKAEEPPAPEELPEHQGAPVDPVTGKRLDGQSTGGCSSMFVPPASPQGTVAEAQVGTPAAAESKDEGTDEPTLEFGSDDEEAEVETLLQGDAAGADLSVLEGKLDRVIEMLEQLL